MHQGVAKWTDLTGLIFLFLQMEKLKISDSDGAQIDR